MKEIAVSSAELEALMGELDDMIAATEAAPKEVPTPEVAAVEAKAEATIINGRGGSVPTPVAEPVTKTLAEIVEAEAVIVPIAKAAEEKYVIAPAGTVEPAPEKSSKGLDHYVDPDKFKREIQLDDSNINKAMMEQAGLRAYYGTQAAYAEAQHARLKAKFEILEAKLYDEHAKLIAKSGEKATQNAIEAAVKRDPRWMAGKSTVIEAETIANVNRNLTFALADRRDMLIQLGSDRRAEMQGQLRLNDPSAKATEIGKRYSEMQGKAA